MQHSKNKIIIIAFCMLVIIGLFLLSYGVGKNGQDTKGRKLVSSALYQCDGGKKIGATYYESLEKNEPKPGEMPIPTGNVSISLDGGPTITLHQTLSGSGVRYATLDESLVFWNKGDEALIMRNNSMDLTYTNCTSFDPRDSSFVIDGKEVVLKNGISETEAAPGSASIVTTRYFGNEARGDLTGDKKDDIAFLVTQETGGSGTFYYVVVAVRRDPGYQNTNAFFVGDRIAPQSTDIESDARELRVNYAERKKGEPMTVPPSQGATLLLKVTSAGVLEGLMK